MIINIDNELVTPRIQTLVRQLVDALDHPERVSIEATSDGVNVTLRRTVTVKYVVVASSYYRAHGFIFDKKYQMDECIIVISDSNGQFTVPEAGDGAEVCMADYHVTI